MLHGYYECWGWGGVSLFSAQLSLPGSESAAADGARPLLHSGSGDSGALLSLALLSTVATLLAPAVMLNFQSSDYVFSSE